MEILTLGTRERTKDGKENRLYRDWTISGTGEFSDIKKGFFYNNKKVKELLDRKSKPFYAIGHVHDHTSSDVSLLLIKDYYLNEVTGSFTFNYEFIERIPNVTTKDIKTNQLIAYINVSNLEIPLDLNGSKKEKIKLFIGSSTESKEDVRFLLGYLNEQFENEIDLYPWYEEFKPGDHVGNRILELASEMDKAVFIFSDDDITSNPKRGEKIKTRDNVIFEYGVMVSKKGLKDVIVVRKGNVVKPTDLDGITDVLFNNELEKAYKAHNIIRKHIKESWL